MKLKYDFTLFILLVGVLFIPGIARAQDYTTCPTDKNECVVEWAKPDGITPELNALYRTILNDTNRPAGRVYILKRGGFYWIADRLKAQDWNLRLIGQTAAEAAPADNICGSDQKQDCGPAIIQRHTRENGTDPDGVMIQVAGKADLTMKNIWIMGQDDLGRKGSYEPLALDSDNSRYTFDYVIFDRNNWHHLGFNGKNDDVTITNSEFRNLFGDTQIWEGLGMRFEVGADTVVIENNTFFNIGFTPFQSETAPVNYLRFNHNTIVNMGRTLQAGALWMTAYWTNNLLVNPFWHGETATQYTDPERIDPYTGIFGIGALPSKYGTNSGRKIVLANNATWRDPAFNAYYTADNVRPQPLVNDTTKGYFEQFPKNMIMKNNYENVDPGLKTYPNVVSDMIQHIRNLNATPIVTPAHRYFWDLGRNEASYVNNVWPVGEDFSYTNTTLLTGGTDGLPVGDLNWFPDKKAQFEANKAQFITQIENMVKAAIVTPAGGAEIEVGTLAGGAQKVAFDKPVYISLREGPDIVWNYTPPAAGDYTLQFQYYLDNGEKGQKIKVNNAYLNGGNDIMFTGAANTWLTMDQPVTFTAGQNTVKIEKSWGWMRFKNVLIFQGATKIDSLKAMDATIGAQAQFAKMNAADPNPPSGWYSVNLPTAGASVTVPYTATAAGTHSIVITYSTKAAQQLDVLVNGTKAATVNLAKTDGAWATTTLENLTLTTGANNFELKAASGEVGLDKVDVFSVTTYSERGKLPEGYALFQNYPNPFRSKTTIVYEVPAAQHVTIEVFDILGRRVATLVDGLVAAGRNEVTFDVNSLSSGVYIYRFQAGGHRTTRTMIVVK